MNEAKAPKQIIVFTREKYFHEEIPLWLYFVVLLGMRVRPHLKPIRTYVRCLLATFQKKVAQ